MIPIKAASLFINGEKAGEFTATEYAVEDGVDDVGTPAAFSTGRVTFSATTKLDAKSSRAFHRFLEALYPKRELRRQARQRWDARMAPTLLERKMRGGRKGRSAARRIRALACAGFNTQALIFAKSAPVAADAHGFIVDGHHRVLAVARLAEETS